jgi:hypothetical protein
MFTDPFEHFSAELQRLDLLIHREILCLRATYQLSLDEFRGLYISDEQVNNFINQLVGTERETPVTHELTAQAEALRQVNAGRVGSHLPWHRLVAEFRLSPIEEDILLLAVAPEIDLKYETLYAYLNNDVTRKWPTCDLALRLLSLDRSQRMSLREYLVPQASLFRDGLLCPIHPAPERPSWLASGFSLTPSVSHFLLGHSYLPPELAPFIEHRMPTARWEELPASSELHMQLWQVVNFFKNAQPTRPAPMLILEGRYGAGRGQAAEVVCQELGLSLLRVDMKAIMASTELLHKTTQALVLQQRLLDAAIYLENGEALFDKEGHPLPEAHRIIPPLTQGGGLVFFACTPSTSWQELLRGQRCLAFHFGEPDYTHRQRLWETYLTQTGNLAPARDIESLANRFILTPGQIKDAVNAASDYSHLHGEPVGTPRFEVLMNAARAQSGQSLGNLAPKVVTAHGWDDLVLPPATLKRVKEIAAAIKYRHVVYAQWGFERRVASGKGLKVLFTGASGTGKTMTAGVIAKDLELDLYKIDLSGVVSKYIGETEKNLERIFRAAHDSNAILFFDEADALFGKRSEVKDAHDRYANIEIAYLLQRMEEHEGAVILASNLSKNIDEAFSRRMHYVLEFPLPDEHHRELLWRGMFPPEVPLGEDVDCRFLAKQFPISGGDIRNVALDAAFLAAQDGKVITMNQLVKAMARQMMKQGRIPSPTDFKQYHVLIAQGE